MTKLIMFLIFVSISGNADEARKLSCFVGIYHGEAPIGDINSKITRRWVVGDVQFDMSNSGDNLLLVKIPEYRVFTLGEAGWKDLGLRLHSLEFVVEKKADGLYFLGSRTEKVFEEKKVTSFKSQFFTEYVSDIRDVIDDEHLLFYELRCWD